MIGHIRGEDDRVRRVNYFNGRATRIRNGQETVADLASPYGFDFDELFQEWAALEDGHDQRHPNRSDCGGVGGCPIMRRADELEQRMIELLNERRTGEG